MGIKKALAISRKGFFVFYLAPRPGLEPGTYGLTDGARKALETLMEYRILPKYVQYFLRVEKNPPQYPCGLQLGDYWILDSATRRKKGPCGPFTSLSPPRWPWLFHAIVA